MQIEDEKKMEIMYDHYKDTFTQQIRYTENRNRYFVLFLVLFLLLLFRFDQDKFNTFIVEKYGIDLVDKAYISSVLYFLMLWDLILYLQSNLAIDNHYRYLHMLEGQISDYLTPFQITREGSLYKANRKKVHKFISIIYKYIFPAFIFVFLSAEFVHELKEFSTILFKGVFNSICLLLMIILLILFVFKNLVKRKIK